MAKGFIRKTIGGWSLERKCLLLLGLALVASIILAFFVNQAVAARLVMETTRRTARDLAKSFIYGEHVEVYARALASGFGGRITPPVEASNYLFVVRELRKDMLDSAIGINVLRLDDGYEFEDLGGQTPKSEIDLQSLQKLATAIAKSESEKIAGAQKGQPSPSTDPLLSFGRSDLTDAPTESTNEASLANSNQSKVDFSLAGPNQNLLFQEHGPENDFYYYYHPVAFHSGCLDCHASRSVAGQNVDGRMPFRVLKVKMPYAETRLWTIWSYSIMIAVGMATVALSLFFIHWILHRLVIRPLRYLRDVSDEVSRGNLSLRSEIDTDDEFYELSDAFNRMLRHLTETQVELQKVNTVLDTRVDQLAQVNLQLYEANRLKSDFLASMSHELRTPLNSILGFSDVLQGFDTLTEKQKRYAANIQKSGRLLLEMINDILDLAKVEAGKMDVRVTRFDLIHLIEGQCEVVRALAEDKNIDLQIELDPSLRLHDAASSNSHDNAIDAMGVESPILLVAQDQAKLQQILTNLVSNAIKFTPQGGIITIAVGLLDESTFRITITDTGVGIAEHDHEAIFEKFRQVRTTNDGDALTREYSGTGLGLSIVRELCRLLGGEITLQSQLGKGSVFSHIATDSIRTDQTDGFRVEFNSVNRIRIEQRATDQASLFLSLIRRAMPPSQKQPSAADDDSRGIDRSSPLRNVELYTDGACSGNPGPGGWAYVLRDGPTKQEREGSGGQAMTTNNQMELMAVIEGLQALKRPCAVQLYADSQYVLQGLQTWMVNWKKNHWRRKSGSKWEAIKNIELWQQLDQLASIHRITFHHVKGHSGHAENERCDELAVAAADKFR